jgi:hypothetical protein
VECFKNPGEAAEEFVAVSCRLDEANPFGFGRSVVWLASKITVWREKEIRAIRTADKKPE